MYISAYLMIFISSNLDKQPLPFLQPFLMLPTLIWSIHHTRGLTTQTFQSVEMLLFYYLNSQTARTDCSVWHGDDVQECKQQER